MVPLHTAQTKQGPEGAPDKTKTTTFCHFAAIDRVDTAFRSSHFTPRFGKCCPLLFYRTGNYRVAKVPFRHWLKRVREHRMKFLLAYGWLPETVDHIDRNGLNNALANLRAATPASQAANFSRPGRSRDSCGK